MLRRTQAVVSNKAAVAAAAVLAVLARQRVARKLTQTLATMKLLRMQLGVPPIDTVNSAALPNPRGCH